MAWRRYDEWLVTTAGKIVHSSRFTKRKRKPERIERSRLEERKAIERKIEIPPGLYKQYQ